MDKLVYGISVVLLVLLDISTGHVTAVPVNCDTPRPKYGRVHNNQVGDYLYDSMVTIQCFPLYGLRVEQHVYGAFVASCDSQGHWELEGVPIQPDCTERLCDSPPQVPHSSVELPEYMGLAKVSSSSGNVDGQLAYYSCNQGYVMEVRDEPKLYCQNAQWVGSVPSCVRIQKCPRPANISHGSFYPAETYNLPLGHEISYSCDSGYKLVGSAALVCMAGGRWSHVPPKCVDIQASQQYCPAPERLVDGHCFCESKSNVEECEPFFGGLHITCVCEEGYKLIGQDTIECGVNGHWDYKLPSCVQGMTIHSTTDSSTNQLHMSTLAIVVATACSVLGILLLIMMILVCRRRKPRPPRLCRPASTPTPYSRVHSNSLDEHDRALLIGYENNQIALPSYEEAISSGAGQPHHLASRSSSGQVGEYRPLPSIPSNLRVNQSQGGDSSNRHSIVTTSTMNHDGVSEVFGSIDTVNVSMSDASTAVTVETFDSVSSHSNMSRRANVGSINSSNGSLVTEDVPLLECNQRDEEINTNTNSEEVQDKEEN